MSDQHSAPSDLPSLDEFVTEVVDALPPSTWDVVVWPGDDMAVSGRIDPADARRILSAALSAIRGDDV